MLFRFSLLPVVVIGGVVYFANGTVRFDERVASVHGTTVAAFVLRLVVTGVGVSNGVREVVFGMRLKKLYFV